ncbi:MAG: BatD family protein [Planctomycetes bacterium]|nr:BatD family protein [Planctomycetota bacterium]
MTVKVSSYETYVNVPIEIQIIVSDAQSRQVPRLPKIPGASILAAGQSSSQRITLGRRGQRRRTTTITYKFLITPHQEGRIEIPAIEIIADGKTYTTEPQVILVTESETGELLFVELYADKEKVYVGDSLTIKLQIWLRPYRDRKYTLNEQDMWRRINQQDSTWGPFAEIIADRANTVTVRSAFRTDSAGEEHSYFVYELKKTLWAERADQYDPGDITILVSYPEELGRVRDPFDIGFVASRRVVITKSRPIVQSAEVAPIEIKPIPVQGRPEDYVGAVGQFRFNVSAKPTDLTVGDPITLSMSIVGSGRLDTLQPPPLLERAQLTEAFKIPTDPIAGVVQGRKKQFTQSIRPRNDTVVEIPAIPFSYFDPRTEKFVTVYSDPIPVTVKPADTMPLADVVAAEGGGPVTTELKELSGGILANYTGVDEVLSHQAFAPGVRSAAAVSLPPVLFFACLVFQKHRDRLQRDPRAARRRSAHRRAMSKIQQSRGHGDTEIAELLAAAVTDYVADRCGLPAGGLTRVDALEQLTKRHTSANLIEQVDNLLKTCESLKFAGPDSAASQNLTTRAAESINQLEREKL